MVLRETKYNSVGDICTAYYRCGHYPRKAVKGNGCKGTMRIAMVVGELLPGEKREFESTEGIEHSCQPPNPEDFNQAQRAEYEGVVNLKERMKSQIEELALEDVTKKAKKIAQEVLAENVALFSGMFCQSH